jgi:hypothetical protein
MLGTVGVRDLRPLPGGALGFSEHQAGAAAIGRDVAAQQDEAETARVGRDLRLLRILEGEDIRRGEASRFGHANDPLWSTGEAVCARDAWLARGCVR